MFQYAEQPQSIGKVLDSGIKLFMASYKNVVGLALLAGILSNLPNFFEPRTIAENQLANPGQMVTFVVATFASMFVGFIFYNAMVWRINAIATGTNATFGSSMQKGIKKLLPVFGGMILYLLVVMLGSMLLLIPGLILMLSLFFYSLLIVIDNRGALQSLKTSHNLVWGNWWRTATVISIPGILIMVVYVALGVIAGVFGIMGDVDATTMDTGMTMIISIVGITASVIGLPLFYAIALTQMHDLKLRKQGSDLEQRLDAG
ncbi:hypothetical protein MNBD_GAMMA13-1200 [hydrothermal vent metagenome]|uniref:DUF7847 domain-containing protein n=1 Tax=hydrothermal vent metagenome TaxID=652676 RepID=A0A3B0YVU8_9ZZZZ